jgi:NAD(P)-dependent dehydrogenase (short-subunit alcohol dehydrogenase family)
MAGTMTGKVALVTGGSSGIGRATCVRFAQEGATVVLAARRVAEGEQTAHLVCEAGGEALFVRADVAQPADVQALVTTCLERYGHLDYACNNAGIEGRL